MAESVFELACARAPEGMEIAAVAAADPRRIALWSEHGEMTFAELNAAANRLVQRLRMAGLERGDAVALVCGNRNEFAVVRFATHRAGLRLTPVNWHLTPEDIRYIVENCEAKALFLDTRVADAAAGCARIAALALRVSHRRRTAGLHGMARTRWPAWTNATLPTRRSATPCCIPRAPPAAPRGFTVRRCPIHGARGASAADC
jgi:acyl-coenzyme A synthetase/AMP-(fatty) acid ligase